MKCNQVRHQLPLLAGDDLSNAEAERCYRHLQDCPACRDLHERTVLSQAVLDRLKDTPTAPTPAMWDRIASDLPPHPLPEPHSRLKPLYYRVCYVAAAAVVVAAVTLALSVLSGTASRLTTTGAQPDSDQPFVSDSIQVPDVLPRSEPLGNHRFRLPEVVPVWQPVDSDALRMAGPRPESRNYFRLDQVRFISAEESYQTDF